MAVEPGGYPVPRFEPRRSGEIVPEWQTRFGAGANTASNTDDGLLIDTLTALSQAVDERGLEAYNSGFFNTAEGLNLDALVGGLFGTQRSPDRGSVGPVVVYGELGTIVSPASIPSEVSTAQRGDVYTLDGPVEIEFTATVVFVFGPTSGVGTSTKIVIDSVDYGPTLTVLGTGLDVANNMWALLPLSDSKIVSKNEVFEDAFGNGVIVLSLVSPFNSEVTATASNAEQFRGVETLATSNEPGPIAGDAFQITTINTTITGWIGVVNLEAVTPGATEDTDAEYRERHLQTLGKGGTSSLIALQSILLDEDRNPGSEYVKIYNNPLGQVDAAGRDAHSFEVVAEGGLTDTIVGLIWENHPLGIRSFGAQAFTVVDTRAAGNHIISLTRPTKLFIWIDVVITAGEGFPSDPISDIQEEVAQDLTAFGATLGIGRDIYIDELLQALSISGTAAIVVTRGVRSSAAESKPSMTAGNLDVDDDQLTVWDVARISTVVQ